MNEQDFTVFRDKIFGAIWDKLDPLEEEIENTETIPLDAVMPVLRDTGCFGLLIDEEYGGAGLSTVQYIQILEEFSKIQGGIRVLMHVHNSAGHGLAVLGNDEQRKALLPGIANGDLSMAFALTEPDHGTGADLGSTARRDGDDYVINGRKWLITNSNWATHFAVFARTGDTEVSVLLVERSTPGLTIEALPETMGCKGGEHGLLTMQDVRVPAGNMLGSPGAGIASMVTILEVSRLFIAVTSLGTAARSLELSVEHAKRRVTFGKPIAERQAVQRYLAEMATDVYALRQIVEDAAAKVDAGQAIPMEASMCKLFGLEAVGRVTDRALLVHGGIGYTRRHPIERLYRDARLNWLEEGTPTIQQLVIARELLHGAGVPA